MSDAGFGAPDTSRGPGRKTGKRRSGLASAFFLAVLSVAVYVPALRVPFLMDDQAILIENPSIRRAGNVLKFLWPRYWREDHPGTKGLYRPAREMLFTATYAAYGLSPGAFHAVSLALHSATVVMVYLAAVALTGSPRAGLTAGVLFAVHPVHVEAVVWAKNAGDLLCAFFALLCLYLNICRSADGRGAAARADRLCGVLSAAAFAVALLSKETALSVPALLVVYWWLQRPGGRLRAAVRRTAVLWLLGAAYAGLIVAPLFADERALLGAPRTIRVSLGLRFAMLAKTVVHYQRLLFVPVYQNAMHQFDHPRSMTEPGVLRDMVMFAAIVAATLAIAARWRRGRLAVLWAGLSLAPVCNAIPYSGRPVGENRLYWPSVGLCLLAAGLVREVQAVGQRRLRRWSAAVGVAAAAVFAALLVARLDVWMDARTLWRDMLRKSPAWPEAYHGLGWIAWQQGHPERALSLLRKAATLCDPGTPPATHATYRYSLAMACAGYGRMEEARRHALAARKFAAERWDLRLACAEALADRDEMAAVETGLRAALDKRPDWSGGWLTLGRCRLGLGDTNGALTALQRGVELDPREAGPRLLLGEGYGLAGRWSEAEQAFRTATDLAPQSAQGREQLGTALLMQGKLQEAEAALRSALAVAPDYAPAVTGLGVVLLERGQVEQAAGTLALAARLAPGDARTLGAYGAALIALGNDAGAIDPLERAVMLAPPGEQRVLTALRDLVGCLVRTGQLGRAVQWQEQVVRLRPGDDQERAALQRLREAAKQIDGR